MNRSGHLAKQLTGYTAFVPADLPPHPPIHFNEQLNEKHEKARLLLAQLNGMAHALPNIDLFIAMYVRKEALLSAQIEGTQASLEDIFEFESGLVSDNINDIEEVVNYLKALNYGLERLDSLPMSMRLLKELHAILLQGVRGAEKTPGEFRKSQNWIGAPGSTLHNASFIPPAPHDMLQAVSNLELYLHQKKPSLPVLIDCALIHYQFETIHPFLDGNGRLGRLLITLFLTWKDILLKPLLYLSYYLKKNRQEYFDRLSMVRQTGDYEQWISFFLSGIIETAQSAIDDTKNILLLHDKHQKMLWHEKIASPAAPMLLEQLFYTPLISVGEVQKLFDISYQSAANLMKQFESLGIIEEITGKKRDKKFAYVQYLKILSQGTQPL